MVEMNIEEIKGKLLAAVPSVVPFWDHHPAQTAGPAADFVQIRSLSLFFQLSRSGFIPPDFQSDKI